MDNILSVSGIKKSFGGVHALKGVDLTIKKGETHCLAGENGCGKSTIIKVISGFYKPDAGTIEVNGVKYPNMTPADAIKAGIQVIYQDFSVFPNLTVMENLAFNQVLARGQKFVNRKEFRRIAEEAVSKINFDVDLDARVETLPIADKQLIAISRALLDDAKLIIMDEPTTALTKKEVARLFDIIKELKKNGMTILFVSHKLEEVFEITDSFTIFRSGENVTVDGEKIMGYPKEKMTEEKFTYAMTGRTFDTAALSRESQKKDNVVLEAKNVTADGISDISFKLHEGEILGITGPLGSGRTELSLSLFGLNRPTSGQILVNGKEVKMKNVKEAQKCGIALVPEDRLTEGLFLPQSIVRNITVSKFDAMAKKFGFLSSKDLNDESQKWVDELSIATKDQQLPVGTLSGGNQQKVVLARWLANDPKVLIMNGPTVGVDIGAKYDIHKLLHELAAKGKAIIIVSDDTAEIIATCDRVLVMHGGKIINELDKAHLTEENLTKAAQ